MVRNIIPNEERAYQNLSRLVSDARLAGLVDWNAIEDRIRVPRKAAEWNSPKGLMDSALNSYRLPRWEDQPYQIELWVEKDALAGVLQPLSNTRHITLMVNRGYSSQTAMHDAYSRMREAYSQGKTCTILYLGDQDPSGEDMVRDISERLNDLYGTPVVIKKLAITPEQVATYNPPPNPAKMSDTRAAKFVEEFGYNSYEVDALPPNVLVQIINNAVDEYVNQDLMDEVIEREERDKVLIREAANQIMEQRE